MKILILGLLVVSSVSWAKTPADEIARELSKDIQKDISHDEDKFRKTVTRLPASVEPKAEAQFENNQKIDKNLRQIGTNKW